MSLDPIELRELELAIADRLFIQVSNWHLYLGDAGLSKALAIECCSKIDQGRSVAARHGLDAVQVPVGGGSKVLPLAHLIPASQLFDLEELLDPYCWKGRSCDESPVLIIEVTNSREVMRRRIGALGERLFGKVINAEAQVEKALIQEIETAFQEFGIEARIISVQGPYIGNTDNLQLPLEIREERKVRIID